MLFIETRFASLGEPGAMVVVVMTDCGMGLVVAVVVRRVVFVAPPDFSMAIRVSDGKVSLSQCCRRWRCGRDAVVDVASLVCCCMWRHKKGMLTS